MQVKQAFIANHMWRVVDYENPFPLTDWQPLWKFEEVDLLAYQELVIELNQINAPVELRIISNSK